MRERVCKNSDIKALSLRLSRARDLGNAGVRRVSETVAEIEAAIDAVSKPEGWRKLHAIPVEELNARKAGIRINLLKDAGYNDMYAICAASRESLASVYGIGDVMAGRAKEIANAVATEVCNSVKLKISTDHKTEEYSRLVTAVAEHMRAKALLPKCEQVLAMLPSDLDGDLERVAVAKNGIKWFFTGDSRKAAAADSFARLKASADAIDSSGILMQINGTGLVGGSVEGGVASGSTASSGGAYSSAAVLGLRPITIADAWADYAARPVEYYNVLEEIAPDRFDSSEDGYGLSDEIRESVENTPVDLTGLKCTLRGYQIWGVKYILRQKRVLLGDEMGLGKTIQALAAMVSLRNGVPSAAPITQTVAMPAAEETPQAPAPAEEKDPGVKHFLVICPASVIVNWCREVEGKSDLKAYNMHDAQRASAFREWTEKGGVAVTNYESLENRFSVADDFDIDMIIVDEAHYIKNIEAKRSQNVLRLCDHTDRILFMTGTPLENRVDEMVGLMSHLQNEVAQEAKSVSVTAYADDFKRKISPVYYRRRRNDVLSELPELTDIKEWCDMTKEDEAAYEDDVLGGSFMDVRRVSWRNADYLNTSAKVQRLREIVEDAADDARKVLVFSFFLDTLEKVKTVFGPACVGVINGAVPVEERQNIVDAFEAAPAGSVLAAQIQSGGTGLNIQSASVVVLCEPQYKPSTENQAIGRAHRMGQTRDVMVHRLLCPDTVDERMLELVEAKQAEFDTFADESSAAERDASLEASGVDVNQGVVVGAAAAEALAGAAANGTASVTAAGSEVNGTATGAASGDAGGAENTGAAGADGSASVSGVAAANVSGAAVASSGEKGELDTASLNKIFADEKARILAKREREAAAGNTSAAARQVTAPAEPVAPQRAFIFCRFCGEKIPPDSRFCNKCGKDIS
ncbi:MAG: DEAD/DEAH box helicase family protein [Lachnospiraceae bacterium]|nr:DEAD/DEAH box helicase family protein [Lachnospiraceae bacterium]